MPPSFGVMHSIQALTDQVLAKPDIADVAFVDREVKEKVAALESELVERQHRGAAQLEALSQRVTADLAKAHKAIEVAEADISERLAGDMLEVQRLHKEELQEQLKFSEREQRQQTKAMRQHLDSAVDRLSSELEDTRGALQLDVSTATPARITPLWNPYRQIWIAGGGSGHLDPIMADLDCWGGGLDIWTPPRGESEVLGGGSCPTCKARNSH
eukprot:234452-Prorocentrum_minimum.AAC.8